MDASACDSGLQTSALANETLSAILSQTLSGRGWPGYDHEGSLRALSSPGGPVYFHDVEECQCAGLVNIIFGLVFIVGGLTGNLSLRGTQSGPALAVVGVALLGLGAYRMMSKS